MIFLFELFSVCTYLGVADEERFAGFTCRL